MPFTDHFYHATTRSIVILFGALFNDMKILRPDGKVLTVPILYGSKEKWYTRMQANPDLENQEAVTLPRMAFYITDMAYDSVRKLNTIDKITSQDDLNNDVLAQIYQPVPYIINMELYLWTKSQIDGLQVLEQIVPFFTPSFTVTLNEIGTPYNIERDVPITLTGVSSDDALEGSMEENRKLEWTLNFDIKMNFYGPTADAKIIREVVINVNDIDSDKTYFRSTTVPDPITAYPEDDFGYTETIEELPDS